ncbi:hypothetical protein GQ42DRAFT_156652 [Ramicandelaber brevisporus]|nr:hypothetical protein GQ42DRAFT_156652 [Ramicandelaber brevisporus]
MNRRDRRERREYGSATRTYGANPRAGAANGERRAVGVLNRTHRASSSLAAHTSPSQFRAIIESSRSTSQASNPSNAAATAKASVSSTSSTGAPNLTLPGPRSPATSPISKNHSVHASIAALRRQRNAKNDSSQRSQSQTSSTSAPQMSLHSSPNWSATFPVSSQADDPSQPLDLEKEEEEVSSRTKGVSKANVNVDAAAAANDDDSSSNGQYSSSFEDSIESDDEQTDGVLSQLAITPATVRTTGQRMRPKSKVTQPFLAQNEDRSLITSSPLSAISASQHRVTRDDEPTADSTQHVPQSPLPSSQQQNSNEESKVESQSNNDEEVESQYSIPPLAHDETQNAPTESQDGVDSLVSLSYESQHQSTEHDIDDSGEAEQPIATASSGSDHDPSLPNPTPVTQSAADANDDDGDVEVESDDDADEGDDGGNGGEDEDEQEFSMVSNAVPEEQEQADVDVDVDASQTDGISEPTSSWLRYSAGTSQEPMSSLPTDEGIPETPAHSQVTITNSDQQSHPKESETQQIRAGPPQSNISTTSHAQKQPPPLISPAGVLLPQPLPRAPQQMRITNFIFQQQQLQQQRAAAASTARPPSPHLRTRLDQLHQRATSNNTAATDTVQSRRLILLANSAHAASTRAQNQIRRSLPIITEEMKVYHSTILEIANTENINATYSEVFKTALAFCNSFEDAESQLRNNTADGVNFGRCGGSNEQDPKGGI